MSEPNIIFEKELFGFRSDGKKFVMTAAIFDREDPGPGDDGPVGKILSFKLYDGDGTLIYDRSQRCIHTVLSVIPAGQITENLDELKRRAVAGEEDHIIPSAGDPEIGAVYEIGRDTDITAFRSFVEGVHEYLSEPENAVGLILWDCDDAVLLMGSLLASFIRKSVMMGFPYADRIGLLIRKLRGLSVEKAAYLIGSGDLSLILSVCYSSYDGSEGGSIFLPVIVSEKMAEIYTYVSWSDNLSEITLSIASGVHMPPEMADRGDLLRIVLTEWRDLFRDGAAEEFYGVDTAERMYGILADAIISGAPEGADLFFGVFGHSVGGALPLKVLAERTADSIEDAGITGKVPYNFIRELFGRALAVEGREFPGDEFVRIFGSIYKALKGRWNPLDKDAERYIRRGLFPNGPVGKRLGRFIETIRRYGYRFGDGVSPIFADFLPTAEADDRELIFAVPPPVGCGSRKDLGRTAEVLMHLAARGFPEGADPLGFLIGLIKKGQFRRLVRADSPEFPSRFYLGKLVRKAIGLAVRKGIKCTYLADPPVIAEIIAADRSLTGVLGNYFIGFFRSGCAPYMALKDIWKPVIDTASECRARPGTEVGKDRIVLILKGYRRKVTFGELVKVLGSKKENLPAGADAVTLAAAATFPSLRRIEFTNPLADGILSLYYRNLGADRIMDAAARRFGYRYSRRYDRVYLTYGTIRKGKPKSAWKVVRAVSKAARRVGFREAVPVGPSGRLGPDRRR